MSVASAPALAQTCQPLDRYEVGPVSAERLLIPDAVRKLVTGTPYQVKVDGALTGSVSAHDIRGPLDMVLATLAEQAGFTYSTDGCVLKVAAKEVPAPKIAPAAPGNPMGMPMPASATTAPAGMMAAKAAAGPQGAWVLNPGNLHTAVQAIATRYGYSLAENQVMNAVGARLKYGESLPMEGVDIRSDMDLLISAANTDRMVLEVDIYSGNKRVVPRFYVIGRQ